MKKRAYRVEDLLDNNTKSFVLEAYDEDGVKQNIISSDNAKRYMSRKYSDFSYFNIYDYNKTVAQNVLSSRVDFHSDFEAWKEVYSDNIQRMYDAVTAKYSPVENYNMIEHHTGTDTALQTPENWKTENTQTPHNWKTTETQTPTNWKDTTTHTPENWKTTETQTPTEWKESTTQTPEEWKQTTTQTPEEWKTTTEGLETDNHSDTSTTVYGFDSGADGVPSSNVHNSANSKSTVEQSGTMTTDVEQSGTMTTDVERTGTYETATEQSGTLTTEVEHSGTYQTETAQSGTMSNVSTQSGTMENKSTYDTTLTRNGNIGVSESSQLAQHELDFRLNNLAYMLLDMFIKEHCVYSTAFDMVEMEG